MGMSWKSVITAIYRFGGERVIQSDVLHAAAGNTTATIVADLTRADHIPSETFECIILTQTLQYIYDVRAAIGTLYRILSRVGYCWRPALA
jgi:ubiquinone/menaquinone biosynthesis C-methylase UbiE